MIKQTAENVVSSAVISEESSATVDQIYQVVVAVNTVINIYTMRLENSTGDLR